jgi:hypothetical protein
MFQIFFNVGTMVHILNPWEQGRRIFHKFCTLLNVYKTAFFHHPGNVKKTQIPKFHSLST